jgi:hypothetical protein
MAPFLSDYFLILNAIQVPETDRIEKQWKTQKISWLSRWASNYWRQGIVTAGK